MSEIPDKTKLQCSVLSGVSYSGVTQNLMSGPPQSQTDEQLLSTDVQPATHSQWPLNIQFPVDKLPSQVQDAVEKQVNLCHPKQRHLRGLLLQTVCREAVKIKTHPDANQKVDMVKSIIIQWPYLREQIGRGFDGWLASIIDCLKTTRRALGTIDKNRSEAILRRKRAASASESRQRKRTPLQPLPSNSDSNELSNSDSRATGLSNPDSRAPGNLGGSSSSDSRARGPSNPDSRSHGPDSHPPGNLGGSSSSDSHATGPSNPDSRAIGPDSHPPGNLGGSSSSDSRATGPSNQTAVLMAQTAMHRATWVDLAVRIAVKQDRATQTAVLRAQTAMQWATRIHLGD